MGKIVKFCNSCDEGFAEKFGFCPNCGKTLQTFEMNPVVTEAEPVRDTAPLVAAAPPALAAEVPASVVSAPAESGFVEIDEPEEIELETAELGTMPVEEIAAPPAAAAAVPITNIFTRANPVNVDRKAVSLEAEHEAYSAEGGFYVTVIEEKNVGKRNGLMLGTLGVMLVALTFGLVYSLFSKDLAVGSINDDIFNAVIVENIPMTVEEEKVIKDKKGGGGGGGARQEKEETTLGDLANQSKTPTRPPDAKVHRMESPALVMPPPQTEGTRKFEQKFDRWGDPNGRFANFSNGTGSGGGQGSGTGTGQGSGRGTGTGSGDGSGSGGGLGDGDGDGRGRGGSSGNPPPPPSLPAGVTQGLKIISKPRPGYTDSARQNNIQGTVILRVTFLASGQVGSIAAVKGLPNGLTEQAIAAARRISFEPAKRDGMGQAVTRQIEYTFSIY